MLQNNQQIRTLVIVVIGKFNPSIIQPFWLAHKGLIKDLEAKQAKVEIVHPQLSRINIGWAFLEVSNDRFEFRSSEEGYFPALKDLMQGVFTCLPETPVSAVGINHVLHFLISNPDKYYEFGNRYAPLNNWSDILDDPRLINLSIIEPNRKDKKRGHVIIKIEPSNLLGKNKGVALSVNDHLTFEDTGSGTTLIEGVNNVWDASFELTKSLVNKISTDLKL